MRRKHKNAHHLRLESVLHDATRSHGMSGGSHPKEAAMEINNFSDEDLKQLMNKYKEKQSRYELIYNEQTIRNERIILNIHLEQVRRWRERNVQAFKESRMDTSS